jgi:Zn finger protein HypA/HybF involved in hydrogenase expression
MIKIQNKKGDTIFKVEDDATKPERVKDECPKCHQSGDNKPGEVPCPDCGRNILHDDDYEEEVQ